jgi:serine-type D-Ala-D-Ala endopeptidase (penicillin-binding protein 7)
VSTAEDLAKMVNAAYHYDAIRNMSTTSSYDIQLSRRGPAHFNNTNILVRNSDWVIGLSKTGFINEAGRCLVMQAQLAGEPVIIVLLDSNGKYSRIGDANRVRKWIEHNTDPKPINDIDDMPITLGQTEMENYYN